jgi:peptide/nickel transport system permease protein
MLRYVMARLAQAIPVIVATTLLTFMLLEVVPGDPIALMMREHIDADVVARVRKEMRLDDPWAVRYVRYMWDALHGDFGTSYKIHRSVSDLLVDAFPKTLALTLAALIFAWGIGIPAGIVGALKHYSAPDYLVTLFSLIGVSVPVFWSGLIFQLIFGWKLGLLPISGYGGIVFLIMPGIVLGWSSAAVISRLMRSSLLEVLGSDFVRTARAKGLTEWAVVFRHALKNSLLPVVTIMAIQVADLLTGAVIVESVFGIPGIGRVSVSAIMNRDVPLLQGSVMLTVVLVVLGNLLADVSYAFLDPRIRYE